MKSLNLLTFSDGMSDGAQGKMIIGAKNEEYNRGFKQGSEIFIKVKEAELFERQKVAFEMEKKIADLDSRLKIL